MIAPVLAPLNAEETSRGVAETTWDATLELTAGATSDVLVEWGDGSTQAVSITEDGVPDVISHAYTRPGESSSWVYTIKADAVNGVGATSEQQAVNVEWTAIDTGEDESA